MADKIDKNMKVIKITKTNVAQNIKEISSNRRDMIQEGFNQKTDTFRCDQVTYTSAHENNFTFFMQIIANIWVALSIDEQKTKNWLRDAIKPQGLIKAFIPVTKKGMFGKQYYAYDSQKLAKHFEPKASFSKLLDIVYTDYVIPNGRKVDDVKKNLLAQLRSKAKNTKTVRSDIVKIYGALWGVLAQAGMPLPTEMKNSSVVTAPETGSINNTPDGVNSALVVQATLQDIENQIEETAAFKVEEPSDFKKVPNNVVSVSISKNILLVPPYAFKDKKFLRSVDMPESIKIIGREAFMGCESLEKIDIPASVDTIVLGAFENCNNLKTIKLGTNFKEHDLLIQGFVFENVPRDAKVEFWDNTSVELKKFVDKYERFDNVAPRERFKDVAYVVGFSLINELKNEQKIKSTSGSDQAKSDNASDIDRKVDKNKELHISASITTITYNQVPNKPNIERVTMDDTVKIIEISAFYKCDNLREIQLSSNLETIRQYAFGECKSLETIVIPEKVKSIEDNAFLNCSNLKRIEFKSPTTKIGDKAFCGCTKLKEEGITGAIDENLKKKILRQIENKKEND